MAFRDPDAIAERLNKYADAITAFVVLECIAFAVGLANKDFYQAAINTGTGKLSLAFAIGFGSANCLLWLCHMGEDHVLGKLDRGPSPTAFCLNGIRAARFGVVVLANLLEMSAYYSAFHHF